MLVHRQNFFWVELKTCSNRNKGSTQAYRREALNIVEDGTQDTSTCAWEYRLQFSSRLLCLTLEWTLLDILLTCFTAYCVNLCGFSVLHK